MLLNEKNIRMLIRKIILKEAQIGTDTGAYYSDYYSYDDGSSPNSDKPTGPEIIDFTPSFSGSGDLIARAKKLYDSFMKEFNNKNLCIAVITNAEAESRILYNNNGDGGDYARRPGHAERSIRSDMKSKSGENIFNHNDRGNCCAFGLFQYNICAPKALGSQLLKHYNVENTIENKEEVVKTILDYDKQVEFMILTIRKVFGKDAYDTSKPLKYFMTRFVKEIENPKDHEGNIRKRMEMSKKFMKDIKEK